MSELKNWAGNYTYEAKAILRPSTVGQVQELVSNSQRVKALGTRHSFNEIADTAGDLISTENLKTILGLDTEARTVTLQGGVRYGELGTFLQERGFALANLASLPHITVAGACATGTHGSGLGLGNLSTAVCAIEIVKADGTIAKLSRESDPQRFPGAVVGLGALGVVTEVTLDVEPTYDVEQGVFEWLPFSSVEANFEAIEGSGYSVSLFTDWKTDRINMVWVKRKSSPRGNPALPNPFFGALPAQQKRHPIPGLDVVNATDQLGIVGPWQERLPHFRLDFTPSSGEELQTEFLVAQSNAVDALKAVSTLAERIAPLLQICEIRTMAGDDLWLSPAYQRDSVAIHFTWKQEWDHVKPLIPEIERVLSPYEARPHWGKLFSMGRERLRELYPKLPDFQNLATEFDPSGKFRNSFLEAKVL